MSIPREGHGAEVQVRDVAKSYGPVKALRGVSLDAAPAEWVTITGPAGSGKSTLLNVIGSLTRADSGTILVDGRPVPPPQEAVEFRRHTVGFVFQDNPLLSYLSAQGNVESALLPIGVGRRERHERSLELLKEVGLADRAEHLPAELSGGQRQAVALARAIANNPRLLLADEPTGALDAASSERALDLLAKLRDRYGMTMLVVSHSPMVADRADRVVGLIEGQITGGGSTPARAPEPRTSS
ncbi:MAG TPA: ABC transporter ATP-binding protein [Solirubrobacteraceae bacterium]|jgi:putative ABC transport system ATP-binding protein